MKKIQLLLLLLFCFIQQTAYCKSAPWVGTDLKGFACAGRGQGFGPYDYINLADTKLIIGRTSNALNLVEIAHFTPEVEGLIKGHDGTLESDLDYTLRAWPNHHRALLSIIRYQVQVVKKLRTGKLASPPECYLQRAIHFSPKDAASYSLYGYYLQKTGHLDEAVKYYENALEIDSKNAKIAYAFSLLLIDLKRYDEAVKYAKIAYGNRKAPKGLKQKLEKLGVWNK